MKISSYSNILEILDVCGRHLGNQSFNWIWRKKFGISLKVIFGKFWSSKQYRNSSKFKDGFWYTIQKVGTYLGFAQKNSIMWRIGCAVPYSDVSKVWNWIFSPLEIDSCIKNSGWLKYEPSRSSISPGYCPFCVT